MKHTITTALIFVFSVLLVSVVSAQSTTIDTEQKSREQQKSENQQANKPEAEERNTKPSKQVFKPTEEISEDAPVPFPVDI